MIPAISKTPLVATIANVAIPTVNTGMAPALLPAYTPCPFANARARLFRNTSDILASTDIIHYGLLQLKTRDIHRHEESLYSVCMKCAQRLYLNILTRACASHEGIVQRVKRNCNPWKNKWKNILTALGICLLFWLNWLKRLDK